MYGAQFSVDAAVESSDRWNENSGNFGSRRTLADFPALIQTSTSSTPSGRLDVGYCNQVTTSSALASCPRKMVDFDKTLR
jgi:hypothetical protein